MTDQNDNSIYISSSGENSDSPIYISSSSSSDAEPEETTFYKVELRVPIYVPEKDETRQEAERIYYSWKTRYLTLEEMEEIIEDYKSCHPDE